MGVNLTYVPVTDVPADVAAAIAAEARQLVSARDWWCEPLHFVDERSLKGSTKLFLPGYSVSGGEELGEVSVDGPDPGLLGIIATIATNGESEEVPPFDAERISRIQRKYSDRVSDQ